MDPYKKTAVLVGMLYIIGTVAGILSVVFTGPIQDVDYLVKVSASENQIVIGVLFVLLMGFALAMIPVLMFPILKKQNEPLALGYIVFRAALETVTYIITAVGFLLLVILSHSYVQARTLAASNFEALGAILKGMINLPMTIFVFSLGALIFYSLLFQSKIIPRWISVWGLIAIVMHLTTGFLQLFGLTAGFSSLEVILNLPIFFQEMVLAVWLIAKGFNPSAIAALSAKSAAREA